MPKCSEKRKLITYLEQAVIDDLFQLELFEDEDDQREREDDIIDEFMFSTTIAEHFRYAVPFIIGSVPKSRHFAANVLPNLDETRFRELIRVNWINFKIIVRLIEHDVVFNTSRAYKQFPVDIQLMIVLYRLGSYGEGASVGKIAAFFGIGDGGTVQIITDRVFKAILNLKTRYLCWPEASERRELVAKTFHELPHCIGYVDGTEIKLAEKPFDDPEAYFSRKHIYSLKVQAVCDYQKKIRHMVLGYPGSVHDSRIFNNCELSTKPSEYFSGAEWLAGDSAYKLTTTVITPYRINATERTTEDRNQFNKTLSKYRIRIEHCFGLMKERFNSLKELKISAKNDESIKQACRWILVCAIIQNILIESGEEEDNFEPPEAAHDNAEQEGEVNVTSTPNEGELKRRALLEIIKELQEK
ncbi:putative nuclease HARBI1 [Armigeres subalbatus]|uniref:putative nuclease HARBI1 n=1 Tax=Armigeres subalbatus TaxID=124917 RepID=UPI002ED2AF17